LLFHHRRSVLDLWLIAALGAWLIQSLLTLMLHARFTVGWYGLYGLTLAAHLVVMVALLAESNRLYARLVLSTSARHREHDARLMSMDAVAAAIARDVGQPLAAATLSLKGARQWLSASVPDVQKAIGSIDEAIAAQTNTFDVIKSTGAVFAVQRGTTDALDLNELVRDTASRLGTELSVLNVSLKLALGDKVSPVLANSNRLQRVLINLITNSMDSLQKTSGRRRRITVRTAPLASGDVVLACIDNGVGIRKAELKNIFTPFYTTKKAHTGLGLSLCQTIVEEHGGQLWASSGRKHGARFIMQLPAVGVQPHL